MQLVCPVSHGTHPSSRSRPIPVYYKCFLPYTHKYATRLHLLLQQYLEQIKSDPEVCTINGTPLPKKPRTTPAAPAGNKYINTCLWCACLLACLGVRCACCDGVHVSRPAIAMSYVQQWTHTTPMQRIVFAANAVLCNLCHSVSVPQTQQQQPASPSRQEAASSGHLGGSAMGALWRQQHPRRRPCQHTACPTARRHMKVSVCVDDGLDALVNPDC